MIMRSVRVTVIEGKEPEYEAFCSQIALPHVKRRAGLKSVAVGKLRDDDARCYCVTMVWKDLDTLVEFAGKDWKDPVIAPEEAHLVATISVEHFDLLDSATELAM